jgi:transmembrane sensor
MSGEGQSIAPRAEIAEDQAAEWLWRQQATEWQQVDQAALDAWLAQSRYHLAAYWRLKAAWDRTERLVALKPGRMQPAKASAGKRFWPTLRFAAAACAAIGLIMAGVYGWSAREEDYATAVGERATISLADGSQVQLNTDSAISVSMGLWQRTVALKRGEAFFKVRHDAARPFSVLAAGHRITDLGTEFAVRTSGDRLEVTLVQGRARLEAASALVQHHVTDLTPGEVAIATAYSMYVAKVPTRTLANALAWRQGKLIFSHVTLAEAASEFNRYNGTKLIIQPEIADLRISGIFDAGSIGPFTTMAKFAFGLRVEKRERQIVVSREKS